MDRILYNTDISINGYWLINEEALKELDQAIESSWVNMTEHRTKNIEQLLDKKVNELNEENDLSEEQRNTKIKQYESYLESRYGSMERKIIIKLDKNKSSIKTKLIDAAKDLSLENELVTGINIELNSRLIKADISIDKDYNKLRLKVTPESEEVSREIFSELNYWATKHKPSKWEQIWERYNGLQWFALMMILPLIVALVPNSNSLHKKDSIAQAHKMLEDGLASDEVTKAIEILLTLETSYYPINKIQASPTWIPYLLILLLMTAILLSIKPKFSIAIGRGKRSVVLWKSWIKLISVTIPAFMFTAIIVPKLLEYF